MLAQSYLYFGQIVDAVTRFVDPRFSFEFAHNFIYELQLAKRGPTAVSASPPRAWPSPNGESLSEVLRGMGLRIPGREVEHVVAALRVGLIPFRIATGE